MVGGKDWKGGTLVSWSKLKIRKEKKNGESSLVVALVPLLQHEVSSSHPYLFVLNKINNIHTIVMIK